MDTNYLFDFRSLPEEMYRKITVKIEINHQGMGEKKLQIN